MQADYVIVGAGSAGCVLANRLTEDPGTQVILIEAGGRDWHPFIHIPAGYLKLLNHPTLTWGYKADKDSGLNGREIPYPRGKVLGGSSSINGLIYIRSQPEDYDHWAQMGNRGWSAEDVAPYFRKSERWEGGADAVHSTDGPLHTSLTRDQPALCQAAIQAGVEMGWDYRPDLNDLPHGLGDHIGWIQQTRGGRFRASAARTYLRPAMKRPNLRVVTDAMVRRVVLDGRRATGVEFERGGGVVERAGARLEVIVSAGAIGSPQLLQLSGIGDPEHLQGIGVPVLHALRGVGRNFQDHFLVRLQALVKDIATLNERSRGIRFAGEVMKYLANGTGMLTYAASLVAASVKVLPESATPDVQALFASASYAPGTRELDTRPGMASGVWQMRPESRGHVLARTADARDQPSINPNYLAEERDRRTMVAGIRLVRAWFQAPALRRYLVEETLPGPALQTDAELLDFARQAGTTVFHASCSCRMGPDAMAVVDDRLRVHGLEALRVIDASVMPAVTSTNTNAPTIMIAEKGADLVKAAARERRQAAAA